MDMNDEEYLREAVREAVKSSEKLKCGTLIVINGKIVGKAFNSQRADKDITAHAELKALRMAGKAIGNKNLTGATVYSTHEPCLMCLTAIAFAKSKRLVFSIPFKDYSPDEKIMLASKEFVKRFNVALEVKEGVLREEAKKELTVRLD